MYNNISYESRVHLCDVVNAMILLYYVNQKLHG